MSNVITETIKGVFKGSEDEDFITSAIEGQTAKIPSSAFLVGALAAVGLSLGFQLTGRRTWGNFVGQWVPTILILGMYNKMVKQHGH